jgi:hypothetical protein
LRVRWPRSSVLLPLDDVLRHTSGVGVLAGDEYLGQVAPPLFTCHRYHATMRLDNQISADSQRLAPSKEEMSMLNLRRLPLFLRVVGILGLLLALAALVMFLALLVSFIAGGDVSRQGLGNDPRLLVTALNLCMLSLACSFAVNGYRTSFRQPNRRPFPLDSWQSQARAIALLAALPFCAIALAAVISPTQDAAVLILFAISALGVFALVLAYVRLLAVG